MDRRFLIVGGTAAAAALLYWQRNLRPYAVLEDLMVGAGGGAGPREPAVTGEVDSGLLAGLWLLFNRIAARWQLTGTITLDEAGFAGIIREKTTHLPSYLTEYREGGRVLDRIEREMRRDAAAFDQLFAPLAPGAATTRIGRLQTYVVGEFIELQIAFGGFRAFGYRNYAGYAAGPLSDPARPPYRTA